MTGDEIRRARKQRGLTQAQLAAAVNTTQSVISELESGARVPNIATVERIAIALGMELRVRLIDPKLAGSTDPADALALAG